MIDIHCHILPALDDGSNNIEESVRMARLAVEGGTRAIIATPHSNNPNTYKNYCDKTYVDAYRTLKARIEQEKIPLILLPGHEIFAAGDFIGLIKSKKLLTLNNSDYALIEFGFKERSHSVYEKLEMVIAEGLTPIIAHPERYAFVAEDVFAPFRLKTMGCLLQVNKGSLKGRFGRNAFHAARSMIKNEIADFLASDAHGPYVRTPYLADVFDIVCEMRSSKYADLLMVQNPIKILQNKKIH